MKCKKCKLSSSDLLIHSEKRFIESFKTAFNYELGDHVDIDFINMIKGSPLVNKDFIKYLINYEIIKETRYINKCYDESRSSKTISVGYHVIVGVHGLGGSSWDLMQLKNSIMTLYPDNIVYCVNSTENMFSSNLTRIYR